MTRAWLGIDVGGTTTRVGVAGADGLVARAAVPTPQTLAAFLETVAEIGDQLGGGGIDGVGVGLPGVVDERGARWVPNVPHLAVPNLGELMAERFGTRVTLANDAHMALLGEAREGAAVGHENVLLVVVGTGIGGALLVAGRILRGAHASAGAMGWTVVNTDDAGDPDHGALERRASGRALATVARRMESSHTARDIVAAARRGDAGAASVITAAGTDLGAAIAGVASVVDPEVVLFSGGLVDALDVLAPPLEVALRRWGSPQVRDLPVRPAALGQDAGLAGAAHAAREGVSAWW